MKDQQGSDPTDPRIWIPYSAEFSKMSFARFIKFYNMECFGYDIQEEFKVPDSRFPYISRGVVRTINGSDEEYEFCYAIDIDYYGDDRALKIPYYVYRWIHQTNSPYAGTFFGDDSEAPVKLILISKKFGVIVKGAILLLLFLCQTYSPNFDKDAYEALPATFDQLWVNRFFQLWRDSLDYQESLRNKIDLIPRFEPMILLYPSLFVKMARTYPLGDIKKLIDYTLNLRFYTNEEYEQIQRQPFDVVLMDFFAPDLPIYLQEAIKKDEVLRKYTGGRAHIPPDELERLAILVEKLEEFHVNEEFRKKPFPNYGIFDDKPDGLYYYFWPNDMADDLFNRMMSFKNSDLKIQTNVIGETMYISREYVEKKRFLQRNEKLPLILEGDPTNWKEFIDTSYIHNFRLYKYPFPKPKSHFEEYYKKMGPLEEFPIYLDYNAYTDSEEDCLVEFGRFYEGQYGITLQVKDAYCDHVFLYTYEELQGDELIRKYVIVKDRTSAPLRTSANAFIVKYAYYIDPGDTIEYFEMDRERLVTKYDFAAVRTAFKGTINNPTFHLTSIGTIREIKISLNVDMLYIDAFNTLKFNEQFYQSNACIDAMQGRFIYDHAAEKYVDIYQGGDFEDYKKIARMQQNGSGFEQWALELMYHKWQREDPEGFERFVDNFVDIEDIEVYQWEPPKDWGLNVLWDEEGNPIDIDDMWVEDGEGGWLDAKGGWHPYEEEEAKAEKAEEEEHESVTQGRKEPYIISTKNGPKFFYDYSMKRWRVYKEEEEAVESVNQVQVHPVLAASKEDAAKKKKNPKKKGLYQKRKQ